MKFLLVDAYDSFVYIIKNYIESMGLDITIIRCDDIDLTALNQYSAIILGPGPGHPTECGYIDIIKNVEGKIPVFGICLGMQAIAEYYGISVKPANSRQHGKICEIENDMSGCFIGLPKRFEVARYHSLIANMDEFTKNPHLLITAKSLNDNYVMGIRHRYYCIEGVQFHPESIMTKYGHDVLRNFFMNAI